MHIDRPPCLPLPLQVVSETSAPALSYEELLDAHPSGEAHKRCRNAPAVYSLRARSTARLLSGQREVQRATSGKRPKPISLSAAASAHQPVLRNPQRTQPVLCNPQCTALPAEASQEEREAEREAAAALQAEIQEARETVRTAVFGFVQLWRSCGVAGRRCTTFLPTSLNAGYCVVHALPPWCRLHAA